VSNILEVQQGDSEDNSEVLKALKNLIEKYDKLATGVNKSLEDGARRDRKLEILMDQINNNFKAYSPPVAVKRPGDFNGGETKTSSKRGRPD
jgi:hypothetical protein